MVALLLVFGVRHALLWLTPQGFKKLSHPRPILDRLQFLQTYPTGRHTFLQRSCPSGALHTRSQSPFSTDGQRKVDSESHPAGATHCVSQQRGNRRLVDMAPCRK